MMWVNSSCVLAPRYQSDLLPDSRRTRLSTYRSLLPTSSGHGDNMYSYRKAKAESGKDEEERECGSNDMTSRETLPPSSEEKTPRSVTHETGSSHIVKHLQFTSWPDHGTPASVDGFIKYVRYVRKSHLTGPILVHCSAGVGRTGVFLCVDVVFCAIEKNFPFNIKNIVTQMREQRYGMIQTKEQYFFCYKVVLQVLKKLLTLD
ncbi:tyrosine-protein phosphatase non-receptor type 20 isoform X6 [Ailuropoda melanoleuca]|uniref:tyrosine-protein phosphatase non-receptor type 20 isoform X6 n=1 Tax=Ailuropoda melanoleuca TaxID=9646 RepID=UPI001494AB60|nr:tyrosine-protein phosphatase non-receptor type 20 isoform X6 [Ailuropoda melanoleuca]